jgi:hypothetical protein
LNNSSNRLSNLLCNRLDRDPSKDQEAQEALTRLAHNPDLQVFLAWLEWQNSTALLPVDPSTDNWPVHAADRNGKKEMIRRIALLFDKL